MADYAEHSIQDLISGISQTEAALRRLREFVETTTKIPTIAHGLQKLIEATDLHIADLEADLDELKSTLEAKLS